MKIFLSQPLKNKTQEQIEYERNTMLNYLKNIYGEDTEINKLLPLEYVKTHTPVECLGLSINDMGKCDKVYIPLDYYSYKVCQAEREIAREYNISISYYDLNDICYGEFETFENMKERGAFSD